MQSQNTDQHAEATTYSASVSSYRAIKEWREDDKPRERLLSKGAAALSDAELLAILIKTGTQGFSALDIGKELLRLYDTLNGIASRDVSELQKVRGMGSVKAITLAAAFEIARRTEAEPFSAKKIIRSPQDIASLYIPRFRGARKEQFYVLLLNTANQVFREILVSEGSLNASIVHPREVFRLAVVESAAAIIVMHNHPSGNLEPSKEDIDITKQLIAAGKMLGIPVHDHLIIAGEDFTSLKQLQLI